MTDNEIIKALECCSEANNCGKCEYEPTEYQIGTVGCCNELMKDALDLINRLQAENERLSQFGGILLHNGSELFKEVQTAKAEAYKEFAERLKKALYSDSCRLVFDSDLDIFECAINNLLKELVGDNNAR